MSVLCRCRTESVIYMTRPGSSLVKFTARTFPSHNIQSTHASSKSFRKQFTKRTRENEGTSQAQRHSVRIFRSTHSPPARPHRQHFVLLNTARSSPKPTPHYKGLKKKEKKSDGISFQQRRRAFNTVWPRPLVAALN